MSGLMKSVGSNENSGVIVPATSSKPTWNNEGTVSTNSEESDPGAPANKSRSNGNELDVPVTKLSSAKVSELMLKVSAYPPSVNGPTVTTPSPGATAPPRSTRPVSGLAKSAASTEEI